MFVNNVKTKDLIDIAPTYHLEESEIPAFMAYLDAYSYELPNIVDNNNIEEILSKEINKFSRDFFMYAGSPEEFAEYYTDAYKNVPSYIMQNVDWAGAAQDLEEDEQFFYVDITEYIDTPNLKRKLKGYTTAIFNY